MNNPDNITAKPSARYPFAISLFVNLRPVRSAKAKYTPVDSIIDVNAIIIIVTMADEWKVGVPKKNGVGKWNQDACVTGANETIPSRPANIVPRIIPSKIEIAFVKPFASKLTKIMTAMVNTPTDKLAALPNDFAATSPPPRF